MPIACLPPAERSRVPFESGVRPGREVRWRVNMLHRRFENDVLDPPRLTSLKMLTTPAPGRPGLLLISNIPLGTLLTAVPAVLPHSPNLPSSILPMPPATSSHFHPLFPTSLHIYKTARRPGLWNSCTPHERPFDKPLLAGRGYSVSSPSDLLMVLSSHVTR